MVVIILMNSCIGYTQSIPLSEKILEVVAIANLEVDNGIESEKCVFARPVLCVRACVGGVGAC